MHEVPLKDAAYLLEKLEFMYLSNSTQTGGSSCKCPCMGKYVPGYPNESIPKFCTPKLFRRIPLLQPLQYFKQS